MSRRGKHEEHEAHGGQWKVAYADFVTAMMAFFLIMWLVSSATETQRAVIAKYFSTTSLFDMPAGNGVLNGGKSMMDASPQKLEKVAPSGKGGTLRARKDESAPVAAKAAVSDEHAIRDRFERQRFEALKAELEHMIKQGELHDLADNLSVEMTPEGLRIQVFDRDGEAMFAPGGIDPTPRLVRILGVIGQVLATVQNKVIVAGHTDGQTMQRGRPPTGSCQPTAPMPRGASSRQLVCRQPASPASRVSPPPIRCCPNHPRIHATAASPSRCCAAIWNRQHPTNQHRERHQQETCNVMSLLTAINSALSGLNAQATALSNISNNVANSSTVGYKEADTEFDSLVLASGGGAGASTALAGSSAVTRMDISTGGQIQTTGVATDIAVNGSGYMVVNNHAASATGSYFVTRAGSFRPDAYGNLLNSGGYYLQGVALDANGNPVSGAQPDSFSALSTVNVANLSSQSTPTTAMTFTANLPSSNTAASTTPPAPSTSTVNYFDPLGSTQTLNFSFTPTVPPAGSPATNTWTMNMFELGNEPNDTGRHSDLGVRVYWPERG